MPRSSTDRTEGVDDPVVEAGRFSIGMALSSKPCRNRSIAFAGMAALSLSVAILLLAGWSQEMAAVQKPYRQGDTALVWSMVACFTSTLFLKCLADVHLKCWRDALVSRQT